MPSPASSLVRGFKANSQRISAEQRALLRLAPHRPLDPRALAAHHGVVLCTPMDLPSLAEDHKEELVTRSPRFWSALSITFPDGLVICVYNPTHEIGRINNSLCHELSHLILRHQHGRLSTLGDCVMRDFDRVQEDEADWLAGSLLVPDAALRRAKASGLTYQETARRLGASADLVRWRWNMSGVDRYM